MVCLPYVRGITEPLTRLLRNDGINVVTRPHMTLQQEFPSPKFSQLSYYTVRLQLCRLTSAK